MKKIYLFLLALSLAVSGCSSVGQGTPQQKVETTPVQEPGDYDGGSNTAAENPEKYEPGFGENVYIRYENSDYCFKLDLAGIRLYEDYQLVGADIERFGDNAIVSRLGVRLPQDGEYSDEFFYQALEVDSIDEDVESDEFVGGYDIGEDLTVYAYRSEDTYYDFHVYSKNPESGKFLKLNVVASIRAAEDFWERAGVDVENVKSVVDYVIPSSYIKVSDLQ